MPDDWEQGVGEEDYDYNPDKDKMDKMVIAVAQKGKKNKNKKTVYLSGGFKWANECVLYFENLFVFLKKKEGCPNLYWFKYNSS